MFNQAAALNAAKLLFRIAFFGAASTVMTYLLQVFIPSLPDEGTKVLLTAVLTYVDRFIHTNENIKANGLLPF